MDNDIKLKCIHNTLLTLFQLDTVKTPTWTEWAGI